MIRTTSRVMNEVTDETERESRDLPGRLRATSSCLADRDGHEATFDQSHTRRQAVSLTSHQPRGLGVSRNEAQLRARRIPIDLKELFEEARSLKERKESTLAHLISLLVSQTVSLYRRAPARPTLGGSEVPELPVETESFLRRQIYSPVEVVPSKTGCALPTSRTHTHTGHLRTLIRTCGRF